MALVRLRPVVILLGALSCIAIVVRTLQLLLKLPGGLGELFELLIETLLDLVESVQLLFELIDGLFVIREPLLGLAHRFVHTPTHLLLSPAKLCAQFRLALLQLMHAAGVPLFLSRI